MTGLYPANMASHGPCRSLEQVKHDLRRERVALLLAQFEAETCGNDAAAADCQRQIADIDARLQGIERAEHGRGEG